MSFLTSFRAIAPRTLRPGYAISSFHTSPAGLSLNESDRNRDNLDNVYEAEKQDQLKNTKTGTATWKSELASTSEETVKADRGEVDSGSKDFKEMQDRTKHIPHEKESKKKAQ
ncbi:hypothetical protein ASPWEDRAFT_26874 [Aspergillus wentii DTO 134E9]|uniref:Uncharacterized protein n=1 Tax=Aspergillus wentii DTO 134E9 TaxID=1073089 RepID=A0A1L9RRB2_ASPWE|nr:uncharacterized protein ASPWEDRAFT_26874 [Aspergillus wentii DTO 134E9]KAI9930345.1 hypothetical protein MW887_011097 [Aspergillus wentii]OJJ37500.1 hypothetical protein ASPWEDRAFT_26874 [Aspergillus wentii DTO 134E9]